MPNFDSFGSSPLGAFVESALGARGYLAGVIWACDAVSADALMELSDADFSVIRSAAPPASNQRGIGGDVDTIRLADPVSGGGRIYVLSAVDFSVITSGAFATPNGAGGSADVVWNTKQISPAPGEIYETSTVTPGMIIRNAFAPSGQAFGDIGGTEDVIWHCDQFLGLVYELSTVDFSSIRSAASPYTTSGYGMGGDEGVIYHTKTGVGQVAELSTVDFSLVRSALSGRNNRGIGGKR